jgi:hypothetical protein
MGERYLLATSNLILAATIIVETGEPVMATRGFLGTDPILTPVQFARMLAAREVRFALAPITSAGLSARSQGANFAQPSSGGRVVDPALWRPDLAPADPDAPATGRPRDRDAAVPSRAFAGPSGRPVSAVGVLLRQMELYDGRPDADRAARGRFSPP